MDRRVVTRGIAILSLCAMAGVNSGSAQPPKAEMTRVPQFENDRAVSWKSVIPPHTESTLHRHDRFRTIIGVAGGDLATVDAAGRKTVTHYDTGKVLLAGADAARARRTRTSTRPEPRSSWS